MSINEKTANDDPLQERLMRLWRRERLRVHAKGLAWALLFLPPLLLVLFGLDRMLDLPRMGRWSFLLLALALFVWQGRKRWFLRLKPFDALHWASRVEKHFPQMGSLLINYVQIVSPTPKASGSQELLGLVSQQAAQASGSIDFSKTVDFTDLRKSLKRTTVSISVFLFFCLLFGDSMSVAMKRYLGWNLAYPTETILFEIPGGTTVAKGSKLSLSLGVRGKVPEEGMVFVRSEGSESWRQIKLVRNEDGGFTYSVNKVEESFEYFFEIGDAFSHSRRDPGSVTVVSPPVAEKQSLAVSPPSYTGLPAYETKNLSSAVPEGSRLTWLVEMSSAISEATLYGPEEFSLAGQIERGGMAVKFSWIARQSGVYQLNFRESERGMEFKGQIHKLSLREDLEPRVTLISPGSTVQATPQKTLDLTVRASDDYGLYEFAILYRLNGEKNRHRISLGTPPTNDSQKDLPFPRSGTWPLRWKIQEDLSDLRSGDLIEIAVEVSEVAPDSDSSRKAVTRTCSVEILSVAEYQTYITTRFNQLQSDLAESERREMLIKHAIEASGSEPSE